MGTIQLRQTERRMIWTFLLILGFCCVFTGMAVAQVDQGAITGVVKDTKGAVVQGAVVTLTNTDTNFTLKGKSGANGEYDFSPIKIGHYTVSASAPRFETTTQENIVINIQDRLKVDITLKLGAVSETVTVTAAPPLLQSESASVGQVMDTDTINNTPLNGRNWVYIAQLTAGVAPALQGNNIARGGGTGDFSANGQRTTQNNFILDGVDNNVNVDDEQNGASYNVKPPPDALAEFKIDTSDYSAEFGHSAGAVLNVSIKSGTNQLHGDLWEYVRNTKFDAQGLGRNLSSRLPPEPVRSHPWTSPLEEQGLLLWRCRSESHRPGLCWIIHCSDGYRENRRHDGIVPYRQQQQRQVSSRRCLCAKHGRLPSLDRNRRRGSEPRRFHPYRSQRRPSTPAPSAMSPAPAASPPTC